MAAELAAVESVNDTAIGTRVTTPTTGTATRTASPAELEGRHIMQDEEKGLGNRENKPGDQVSIMNIEKNLQMVVKSN